jgi:magnesium transporter
MGQEVVMTLKSVVDLLSKQKIIEGMVRTQPMQRHELVEMVVHKKHLAELQTVLASLSVGEIGKILAELPLDDARLLWRQIEEDRLNDLLWEVSSSLGGDLADDREPHFHTGEVTAYELVDGIPNGKNILTSNSLIYETYRNNVTVSYADPVGPI